MRLVIFDCDGVLVDSETLGCEVESSMLTQAGFPIGPREIARRFIGVSYATMLSQIGEDFGREVPQELSEKIQRSVLDLFPTKLQPVPGIVEVLEELSLPRCVASSSDLDRVRLSLHLCDMERYFPSDTIFSAQMVRNGKPAPDLFLLAAESMKARPAECLVIEDSPPGVEAARAAGMTAVGFLAGGHAGPELEDRLNHAGASAVFATGRNLAKYLEQIPGEN